MNSREALLWLIVFVLVGACVFGCMRILNLQQQLETLQEPVKAIQSARVHGTFSSDQRIDEMERKSWEFENNLDELMGRVGQLEYRQNMLVEWVRLETTYGN